MSEQFTIYRCKYCNEHFIKEDWYEVSDIDECLLGHIQMDHEEVFDELQNLETPDMISIAYDVIHE